jgi:hypothetical protein
VGALINGWPVVEVAGGRWSGSYDDREFVEELRQLLESAAERAGAN